MQVPERVGLRGIARRARRLDDDIRQLGERAKLVEIAKGLLVLLQA